MRIVSLALAASFSLLAGCGGPETSQANNSQANIGNDAQPPATAEASNLQARISLGTAKQVMHDRHEGMESIGKAFKALHREFDSSAPATPIVRNSAAQIAGLSKKASGWFPAGTGPDVGETGAKADIWRNQPDFKAKLLAFQRAAATFNAAASGNDVNVMKARYAELGATCKACHEKYRAEMKH